MASTDWSQGNEELEEQGMTEDEMAGWHHWLDGHESEWTPGVGDGPGALACWDSWGRKESDHWVTELNWTDTVNGFGIVNKLELDIFLELSCFFNVPPDVGNMISDSSAFSKSSLSIWKFSVHTVDARLENFEHYFPSVWDEHNCVVL